MKLLPLHVRSSHSFLASSLSPRIMAGMAKKRGFPFLSVTDEGRLSAIAEIDERAFELGIKPLIGMDIRAEGLLFTLFAKDEEGYENLLLLEHQNGLSGVDLATLSSHSKGLVAVFCFEFGRQDEYESPAFPGKLSRVAMSFPRFYLGIPYSSKDPSLRDFIRGFSLDYPYETIAFPLIRYLRRQDAILLELLKAIEDNAKLEIDSLEGDECYLEDGEAAAYYSEQELSSCLSLANACSAFSLKRKRGGLPRFDCPEGFDSESYLREKAYAGLKAKSPNFGSEYAERLEKELSIIHSMGYDDYFLIVDDYVRFAKSQGILVGPGRGSSGASLVAYALGIVKSDPIKHGLLFERFLNPSRRSMPDIDVDFADYRRDEVVAYIKRKYGEERVGKILALQNFQSRLAIRSVGKALGYGEKDIGYVCSFLQDDVGLRESYKTNRRFAALIDSDPYYRRLLHFALKIEGLPRLGGLHPAGIVINDSPLCEKLPCLNVEGTEVAQLEMGYLEGQGFLKMDLLSLKNLRLIEDAIKAVKEHKGVAIDAESIPYDDKEAISVIASGREMGLFQLESEGMKRTILQIKPDCFEDVVAAIALYRPGPKENIPHYAKRKEGSEAVEPLCQEAEPILRPTYGIIVYQEQIMAIAVKMAGFNLSEADDFRRAISKKDPLKMAMMRERFVEGCLKNGVSRQNAEKTFAYIERFANYGFNKAHSVCYAILTCQMAYLKAHHPLEFYSAILGDCALGDARFKAIKSEMCELGAKLLPPSIDSPHLSFSPEGERSIRLSLSCIKGLKRDLPSSIITERRKGAFEDIFEFAKRLAPYGLELTDLVALIDAGALDCLNQNRTALRLSAPSAIDYASLFLGGGILLSLSLPKPALVDAKQNREEELLAEQRSLGAMISGSPLEGKEEIMRERGLSDLSGLQSRYFKVACIVSGLRQIKSSGGKPMAFLSAGDGENEAEFVVFPDLFDSAAPKLKVGEKLEIDGETRTRDGKPSFVATAIKPL